VKDLDEVMRYEVTAAAAEPTAALGNSQVISSAEQGSAFEVKQVPALVEDIFGQPRTNMASRGKMFKAATGIAPPYEDPNWNAAVSLGRSGLQAAGSSAPAVPKKSEANAEANYAEHSAGGNGKKPQILTLQQQPRTGSAASTTGSDHEAGSIRSSGSRLSYKFSDDSYVRSASARSHRSGGVATPRKKRVSYDLRSSSGSAASDFSSESSSFGMPGFREDMYSLSRSGRAAQDGKVAGFVRDYSELLAQSAWGGGATGSRYYRGNAW